MGWQEEQRERARRRTCVVRDRAAVALEQGRLGLEPLAEEARLGRDDGLDRRRRRLLGLGDDGELRTEGGKSQLRTGEGEPRRAGTHLLVDEALLLVELLVLLLLAVDDGRRLELFSRRRVLRAVCERGGRESALRGRRRAEEREGEKRDAQCRHLMPHESHMTTGLGLTSSSHTFSGQNHHLGDSVVSHTAQNRLRRWAGVRAGAHTEPWSLSSPSDMAWRPSSSAPACDERWSFAPPRPVLRPERVATTAAFSSGCCGSSSWRVWPTLM